MLFFGLFGFLFGFRSMFRFYKSTQCITTVTQTLVLFNNLECWDVIAYWFRFACVDECWCEWHFLMMIWIFQLTLNQFHRVNPYDSCSRESRSGRLGLIHPESRDRRLCYERMKGKRIRWLQWRRHTSSLLCVHSTLLRIILRILLFHRSVDTESLPFSGCNPLIGTTRTWMLVSYKTTTRCSSKNFSFSQKLEFIILSNIIIRFEK